MLDAISGARVYGKNIVQAEAFTEIRIDWDEHPGMIKALGDRNLALGANRLVNHVFTHNPWLDRKPGMTLDRVGLFFQRDQTWWGQVHGYTDYLTRCQSLLQLGNPAVDIAVFSGEEIPRRALTPDRLVSSLPGIFGTAIIESEKERIKNTGSPMRELPGGVSTTRNMADPEEWIDPLKGYAYDSFNKDALLRLAQVKNGRIVLPGGSSYAMLLIPGTRPLSPHPGLMSVEVASKILEMVKEGATVIFVEKPQHTPGLSGYPENGEKIRKIADELFGGEKLVIPLDDDHIIDYYKLGKGRVISGPYYGSSFEPLGIEKDVVVEDMEGNPADDIAWTHRIYGNTDIYFLSNQKQEERELTISFRTEGKWPGIINPVSGEIYKALNWKASDGRTGIPLKFPPDGSLFIIFSEKSAIKAMDEGTNYYSFKKLMDLDGPWEVQFDQRYGGPGQSITMEPLTGWTTMEPEGIKYYSGTAVYRYAFRLETSPEDEARYWLDLGKVLNIAEVRLNGETCGVAWTEPFRLEITGKIHSGENQLEISVSNTWANRIMLDHHKQEEERLTWTTAPYRLRGKPLLESGLMGPVTLLRQL